MTERLDVPLNSDSAASGSPAPSYWHGDDFFPSAPFKWLAPLWFFGCGVIGSTGWQTTGSSVLRFLLGLLVVGPLLGTAWLGGRAIGHERRSGRTYRSTQRPFPLPALPYTLPGSAGDQLHGWLVKATSRWQQLQPVLPRPLLELGIGSASAVIVAMQLGPSALFLVLVYLIVLAITCASKSEWTQSTFFTISWPLASAWLLGHLLFAPVRLESIVTSAGFALAMGGCARVNRSRAGDNPSAGLGLFQQVAPHAVVVLCVYAVGQPVIAMVVALLASAQLLWAPLLATPVQRGRYFGSVQWLFALAMVLAASALGRLP